MDAFGYTMTCPFPRQESMFHVIHVNGMELLIPCKVNRCWPIPKCNPNKWTQQRLLLYTLYFSLVTSRSNTHQRFSCGRGASFAFPRGTCWWHPWCGSATVYTSVNPWRVIMASTGFCMFFSDRPINLDCDKDAWLNDCFNIDIKEYDTTAG